MHRKRDATSRKVSTLTSWFHHTCVIHLPCFNKSISISRSWKNEQEKPLFGSEPDFRSALARAFFWEYIRVMPLVTLQSVCVVSQPIVFRFLLGFFAQPQQVSFRSACLLAALLVFINIVQALCGPHIVYDRSYIIYRLDNAAKGLIYKKVSRQSKLAEHSVKF